MRLSVRYLLLLFLWINPASSNEIIAKPIHIAVASNFTHAMQALVKVFEQQTHQKVILSFGSTGKLYAQISHGAPYDAFFAADIDRPRQLQQLGVALADSRFTYATGKLVLWSPQPGFVDDQGKVLTRHVFRHLAMANPRLAPYGLAAKQVLQNKGLWDKLQPALVRGENIGQTYQFIHSGNAQLGFIALSQLQSPGKKFTGSLWEIPASLYSPISQQAVLLTDNPIAKSFLLFIQNETSREIIRQYGYQS